MTDLLQKRIIAIRYWLIGKEYNHALKAMELAASYHTGSRKDGFTPEFSHQILIAMYVKTLYKYLLYPEDTFVTIFCHDLKEDYNVSDEVLSCFLSLRSQEAINVVTKGCDTMPKKGTEAYYNAICDSAVGSVVKATDRMHNIQSMPGVFDKKKQCEYIEETEMFVLPMIKLAKRKFPEQEPIYENVKLCLLNQIEIIKMLQ